MRRNRSHYDVIVMSYPADHAATNQSHAMVTSLSPRDLNIELAKVFDWLALHELSLNVRKNKYAIIKEIQGVVPNL